MKDIRKGLAAHDDFEKAEHEKRDRRMQNQKREHKGPKIKYCSLLF
jgi:hypothetical protein